MATITITIADEHLERVLTALATRFGYNPAEDGPRGAFVKAKIVQMLKQFVLRQEQDDFAPDDPDIT